MPKMLAEPEWDRLTVAGRPIGVDRENRVLRGYVVAQAGPFKSDGRGEFDVAALEAIVRLGNAKPLGLKSRFTHPDMSSDGLGKFLGRAKDLSMHAARDERTGKEVPAVRADLHFDPSASNTPTGDLAGYVLDLAESDPDALSSSIVVQADREFRLNPDGTRLMGEDGQPLPPLWRPTKLHASDIVDTGDAVDGLLSAGVNVDGLPLGALWKGAELLDSVFADQPREVVEARLRAWLDRYLTGRFAKAESMPNPEIRLRKLKLTGI